MSIVYFNDAFIAFDEAKIPITDKGFLFGKGVFTTMLVLDGKIFFLKEHLNRLGKNCLELNIPKKKINTEIFKSLIKKNKAAKGRWRLKAIITVGEGDQEGILLMTLQKEDSFLKKSLKLCFYPYPVFSPYFKMKTMAYIDRFYLKQYAEKKGYDDCITLDENNYLLDAAIANIFWIKENKFYYPHPTLKYLRGTALSFSILVAKKLGLSINAGKFMQNDLENSELFYCNSIKGVVPVSALEKVQINYDEKSAEHFTQAYWQMAVTCAI